MPFTHFLAMSTKILAFFYSIIGLGAIIVVHELGHFLFCKLFNIHTPTFSIGFGPELYRRKIGNTDFRVAAIPLGGYVEIAGLAEIGQGEQKYATLQGDTSFASKPYWQKASVLLGGILFNILFAYCIFCTFFIIGSFKANPQLTVSYVLPESAAEKYELKADDIILGIDNTTLATNPELLNSQVETILLAHIHAHPQKEIALHISRNGTQKTIPITLGSRKEGTTDVGVLGAAFHPIKLPFFYAFLAGIKHTNTLIISLVNGIKKLFSSCSLEGAAGPVMILTQGAITASHGILPLLHFLAIISLSVALTNLLPIGALDGGQLLFVTIEAIIRRQIPDAIKIVVNAGSLILILGLTLFFTYREIVMLFGDKIHAVYTKIMELFRH